MLLAWREVMKKKVNIQTKRKLKLSVETVQSLASVRGGAAEVPDTVTISQFPVGTCVQ